LSWGKPTQPNGAYTTDQFFKYEENVLEIVSTFTYLGIVFTTGGYFNTCFEMLAGQALKDIFKLKSNLLKFPGITIQHRFDLFNKFILPIRYYGVKVWGLNEGIQSCTFLPQKCLEGRGETQNNFVYGELCRTNLKSRHAGNVIKYWFNTKYVKNMFPLMYRKGDNNPTHMPWASNVKNAFAVN